MKSEEDVYVVDIQQVGQHTVLIYLTSKNLTANCFYLCGYGVGTGCVMQGEARQGSSLRSIAARGLRHK
jgi:hypothetical protein